MFCVYFWQNFCIFNLVRIKKLEFYPNNNNLKNKKFTMQNITVAGIEETANSRKTNEKPQEKQNNNNGFDKKN